MLHGDFLTITPISNPSKHYGHIKKAVVTFSFQNLELRRHCRFKTGSF